MKRFMIAACAAVCLFAFTNPMAQAGGDCCHWWQIFHRKDVVVIETEMIHTARMVWLDGRPRPGRSVTLWPGYSLGRWDGDTLVVETTNFRDGGWLDINGSPLTDAARMTERFRRPNYGTLQIEITVDDPKAYTKPWTVTLTQRIMVDTEMIEFICNENEKSSQHFVK